MKIFLARCIFFLLLFCVAKSNALPVINGSDTVCAGYMYSYKVIMPAAVTFTWTLPTGWYFLYGQGTDSVFVNCNTTIDTIRVVGLDSAGVPIDSAFKPVHWGTGGMGWHVDGYQTFFPPCYCYSSWSFNVVMDLPGCPGGCGSGIPNPNIYFGVFQGPFSYWNYLGPIGPSTSVSGPMTIYVFLIDTTLGLPNMMLVSGGGGCGNVNYSFTVPADPPCIFWVSLYQNPDPVCVGDTFTVTIGSWWQLSSYWWSAWGDIVIIGSNTGPTLTAVLTGTGGAYIDFSGSDWNWCYSYYGNLNVNFIYCGPPIVAFSANNPTVCAGSCRTFSNSTQYATSYQWSFPGGNPSSSTLTNPNVCYSTPGQYSVTLTAFNSYGSAVLTQTNYISVGPVPVVSASLPFSICSGQSTMLYAYGANTYTWSPSSSLNASTGSSVTAFPFNTTTYTVVGSANGCTATATTAVNVFPLPLLTVSPTQTICAGQSVTLNASGAVSYWWSPSSSLSSATGSSVTATPSSTTTYSVTGTSSFGCTASFYVTVIVNPLPAVSVSPDDTVCTGQSAALTAWGANTYSWSPSASLSASTGSTVTATPAVTTTYTVTGNLLGCSSSQQVTVTVSPPPILSVTPSATICAGQSTTLNATGAGSYLWSPSSSLSSSTAASVIANPTSTTTYTVIGNMLGCTASSQVTVMVNPAPVVSVSPNDTICAGQSVSLTATGANTYLWSPSSSLNSSTTTSVTANPSSTTTYTVVGDVLGCTATSQVTVIVNPLPTVSVTSSASICSGQPATLTASGASTYSWSPSSSLNTSTGPSVIANPSSTTIYTVTATGNNGCSATSQVTVTVFPLPVIVASPSVITICKDDTATLTVSGANTYTWSPSTGLSSSTGSSVIAIPDSTTIYTVTATDINGCTASVTITVNVLPSPTVIASNSGPVCTGSPVTITATGANTYLWQPGNMTSASAVVYPTVTAIYSVVGTGANGCSASATTTVVVNQLPVVILDLSPVDTQCTSINSVLLSGGNPSGGTYSGTAVTGNYFNPQAAGMGTHQITYTYTDSHGCTNTATSVIYVDICTGVNTISRESAIEIYPNPTNGEFNIKIITEQEKDISLRIFDVTGRVIFERKLLKIITPVFHSVIDLENEAEGLYYLQLAWGNDIITRKIIIER
jgi:PKD repeat protein